MQGRAGEGMAQLQAVSHHAHQPRRLGRLEVAPVGPQQGRRAEHGAQVAGLVGGRDAQDRAGAVVQALGPLEERPLHLARQRQVLGQRRVPGQLVPPEGGGELHQRERVASGQRDQPLGDVRGQVELLTVEQGARGRAVETLERELGHAGRLQTPRLALARRQQHRHRLAVQAPGGEAERLGRGAVQPLRVLHQHQQGLLLGEVGQQSERSQADQEAVLDRLLAQPEGPAHGRGLGRGQAVQAAEPLAHHLMQRREGQVGLPLDPDGAQHPHALGPLGGVAQEGGLAHARLAPQDQGPAV